MAKSKKKSIGWLILRITRIVALFLIFSVVLSVISYLLLPPFRQKVRDDIWNPILIKRYVKNETNRIGFLVAGNFNGKEALLVNRDRDVWRLSNGIFEKIPGKVDFLPNDNNKIASDGINWMIGASYGTSADYNKLYYLQGNELIDITKNLPYVIEVESIKYIPKEKIWIIGGQNLKFETRGRYAGHFGVIFETTDPLDRSKYTDLSNKILNTIRRVEFIIPNENKLLLYGYNGGFMETDIHFKNMTFGNDNSNELKGIGIIGGTSIKGKYIIFGLYDRIFESSDIQTFTDIGEKIKYASPNAFFWDGKRTFYVDRDRGLVIYDGENLQDLKFKTRDLFFDHQTRLTRGMVLVVSNKDVIYGNHTGTYRVEIKDIDPSIQ